MKMNENHRFSLFSIRIHWKFSLIPNENSINLVFPLSLKGNSMGIMDFHSFAMKISGNHGFSLMFSENPMEIMDFH